MKKKIIKLTENHILKIVKAVLNEEDTNTILLQVLGSIDYNNPKAVIPVGSKYQGMTRDQFLKSMGFDINSTPVKAAVIKLNAQKAKNQNIKISSKDDIYGGLYSKTTPEQNAVSTNFNANTSTEGSNYNISQSSGTYNRERLRQIANQLINSGNSNAKNVSQVDKNKIIKNKNSKYNDSSLKNYLSLYKVSDDEILQAIYMLQHQKSTQQKTTWRMNNNFPLKFSDKGDKIAQMQKVLGVKPTGQFWLKTEEKIKNANVGYTRNTGVTEDMYNKIMNINSFTNNQESNSQIPYSRKQDNGFAKNQDYYDYFQNQQTNPEPQKMKSKSFSQNTPNIKQPQIK